MGVTKGLKCRSRTPNQSIIELHQSIRNPNTQTQTFQSQPIKKKAKQTLRMDASKFNSQESQQLNQLIEKKQMKDFLKLYSGLVERCFMNCCNDFTSRSLSTKEETCVNNCTDKFLKHSERVGARFSEHNAEMMEKQQQMK